MVCRLVEDKEIHRRQQQANHSETATFTTAQHFHFLFRSLTAKHKRTEYVVNFQSNITFCHPVDGVEDGEVLVEHLSLILCKITYLHIMTHFQTAVKWNFIHYTFHQR